MAIAVLLAACGSSDERAPTPAEVTGAIEGPTPATVEIPESSSGEAPYILFNQRWIETLSSDVLDLNDVDAVFWHVFSGLPKEVTVYPSENYYYFIFYQEGRQVWGNIRLPAGRRDRGVLSFGYFEFRESPFGTSERLQRSKFFTLADGLIIDRVDGFKYVVHYGGKAVIFNLHRLRQDPPQLFTVPEDEVFIERTFDESGFQFFLLFNKRSNYFLWVLNEEEVVPDILDPLDDDLLVGKRSGFAFYVDEAHGDRKVFAAVRGFDATRNDYYDGPFDQLADNYVDQTNLAEYIQLAFPSLRGRIDKYGYYTDRADSSRVAIYTYFVYFTEQSLRQFVRDAKASADPYHYISLGGRLATRGVTPVIPTPVPDGAAPITLTPVPPTVAAP